MERTLFIIKPEVFDRRDEIKKEIDSTASIRIVAAVIIALSDVQLLALAKLDKFYSINSKLTAAFLLFMQKGRVEVGIIEGVNAVSVFKKLCGTHPDPCKCSQNTLRYRFGKHKHGEYAGQLYFLNGLHKSDSREDAEIEIEIFEDILKSGN